MITGKFPNLRLRRSRKNDWSRRLIEENNLTPSDFILPIFLIEGKNKKQKIASMPGVYRYTLDKLASIVEKAIKSKIPMVALFPHINNKNKNEFGTESLNENNLVCKAIRLIKKKYKNEIGIMCDVALDIKEGADMVMVKPGLPYLDIIKSVKEKFKIPVMAYQVSGEYSLLENSINKKLVNKNVILESLISFKRAGANAIVSYYADRLDKILK